MLILSPFATIGLKRPIQDLRTNIQLSKYKYNLPECILPRTSQFLKCDLAVKRILCVL